MTFFVPTGDVPGTVSDEDIQPEVENTEALRRYAETAVAFMVLNYPEVMKLRGRTYNSPTMFQINVLFLPSFLEF